MNEFVLVTLRLGIGYNGVDNFIEKLLHVIDNHIIVLAVTIFSFCWLFLRITIVITIQMSLQKYRSSQKLPEVDKKMNYKREYCVSVERLPEVRAEVLPVGLHQQLGGDVGHGLLLRLAQLPPHVRL